LDVTRISGGLHVAQFFTFLDYLPISGLAYLRVKVTGICTNHEILRFVCPRRFAYPTDNIAGLKGGYQHRTSDTNNMNNRSPLSLSLCLTLCWILKCMSHLYFTATHWWVYICIYVYIYKYTCMYELRWVLDENFPKQFALRLSHKSGSEEPRIGT
jgi:hypothetical protein